MEKKIICALLLTTILFGTGCKKESKPPVTEVKEEVLAYKTAKAPLTWIKNRVSKAEARLKANEAGMVIWQAMEAHGGLQNWYENGPVSFRFNYQPLDGGTPRDTYQTIDTWGSKARHYQVGDSTSQYGWNGQQAWVIAKDSTTFTYNTRFWSLTPYFFMAQPFVLDGKGVNLELLPQKTHQDKLQDVVKVTFDEGTGDAPDDYYILYFDSETHRLSVIRYIVSYPGYFEKGKHLPEKLMVLLSSQTINGILFPKSYKTHWLLEDETAGEHITTIDLSNVVFLPGLKENYFAIPEEAKILEGL
ncbi:MAG: DUF6503 family protein [Bacteroidota bacterium]